MVLATPSYTPNQGGTFSLRILGTTNIAVRLEYGTGEGNAWREVTNHAPPGGSFRFTTNGVGTASRGFFRARYSF